MNKVVGALVITAAFGCSMFAQKQIKPWKEWTRKDAEKILNESAWSQTQTESEAAASDETTKSFGDTRGRESGITTVSAATTIKFRVRFFSARPIRQAYVRMIELSDTPPDEAASQKLDTWANLQADDQIILSVAHESTDKGSMLLLTQVLTNATTESLKTGVYLERKDGKRLYLTEYVPPSKDLFGARYKFPRTIDGEPFLTSDSGVVRFHAELRAKAPEASNSVTPPAGDSRRSVSPKFKVDVKFKVAEMTYNGDVEY